jgi:hypothetical protein
MFTLEKIEQPNWQDWSLRLSDLLYAYRITYKSFCGKLTHV